MSKRYALVKRYYDAGLWSALRVRHAVEKGWITAAEYRMIVGQTYEQS